MVHLQIKKRVRYGRIKKVLIKDLTDKIKMLDGKDKVELLKLLLGIWKRKSILKLPTKIWWIK